MLLLIPHEIETLHQRRPWANWLILGACVVVSLLVFAGALPDGLVENLVLTNFSLPGVVGHVLLHADFGHLLGNMIFLWVFGNAICMNVGNGFYFLLFLGGTLAAAGIHLLLDGSPAIGASGTINGVVGVVLAMYPLNRVHLFWVFLIRGGSFPCPAWVVILAWLAFDLWGALAGVGSIAYWAHIGGLVGGVCMGLLALQFGWIRMTDCDSRCLLEILKRETWD